MHLAQPLGMRVPAILLLLLVPAAALANDPMAGWLHQQQMAYQRSRASRSGARPLVVPSTSGRIVKKAVKPAATPTASEKSAETVAEKNADTSAEPTVEETKVEASAPAEQAAAVTGPSAAYRLGRMVRRMLDAAKQLKPKLATSAKRAEPTAVEPKHEAPSGEARPAFVPPARAQLNASAGSLYLLRQARLITAADYQAGLLRFLGAR